MARAEDDKQLLARWAVSVFLCVRNIFAQALIERHACNLVVMDATNKALCIVLRHPPRAIDSKPLSIRKIRMRVWKKDGTHPSFENVRQVIKAHRRPDPLAKETRGRKKGWRKTSKAEDKLILQAFHKTRPPGHGFRYHHELVVVSTCRVASPLQLIPIAS